MAKIILFIMIVTMTEFVSAQGTDSVNFTCGKNTIQYFGQTYQTVKVGHQCWLTRNLNIGAMVSVSKEQSTKVGEIEKYCYNDDSANCATYGGLYQWDEAMQHNSESAQGICPNGWHIPTLDELQTLSAAVNHDANALKAVGQGLGDGDGTNLSGFSALLAGFRHFDGYYDGLGTYVYIWSSIEGGPNTAYLLRLTSGNGKVYQYDSHKTFGHSVRCLKD